MRDGTGAGEERPYPPLSCESSRDCVVRALGREFVLGAGGSGAAGEDLLEFGGEETYFSKNSNCNFDMRLVSALLISASSICPYGPLKGRLE
jgi:hypothetical protein